MKYTLILALLALLCAGCGQKGPLYMPPPEPADNGEAGDKSEEAPAKPQPQPQKGQQ